MAYKQVKKYGYRDSLEKGDPEKVIYGVDFDAEFEAIEEAFDGVPGAGGGPIAPEEPGFEDVVFQTRTEDQQVVSKFAFTSEKLGESHGPNRFVVDPAIYAASFFAGSDMIGSDSYNGWDVEIQGSLKVASMGFPPFSMSYNGMGMQRGNDAYVRHYPADDPDNPINNDPKPERWAVKPSLDVEGDLNVDNNVTIGGAIDGDLTVNGNIIIDGGTITQPGGEPIEGPWHIEDDGISYKGAAADPNYAVYINGTGSTTFFGTVTCSTLESRFWKCTPQDTQLVISSGNLAPYHADGSVGKEMDLGSVSSTWKGGYFSSAVNAGSFVKSGGTATQLLRADGTVEDATKLVKTTGNQTIAGVKTFSSNMTVNATVTANAIVSKGNVTAYSSSDERLKDDIAPMPVGLIDAVEPATWKWKEDGRSSGGVVAQQLQQAGLGDWVREAPNGDLGVDSMALIGMLIAEVQDLKRRLADG